MHGSPQIEQLQLNQSMLLLLHLKVYKFLQMLLTGSQLLPIPILQLQLGVE